MYLKSVAYNRDELLIKKIVILGVHINETCYKTGRFSTRDFTVGDSGYFRLQGIKVL